MTADTGRHADRHPDREPGHEPGCHAGHGHGHEQGHEQESPKQENQEQGNRRLSPAARAATGLITGYRRYISPFLGPRCRFYPTCSAYAGEAVTRFGIVRGGWLALRRIVRCQPLCEGGVDPLPEQFNWLARNTNDHE